MNRHPVVPSGAFDAFSYRAIVVVARGSCQREFGFEPHKRILQPLDLLVAPIEFRTIRLPHGLLLRLLEGQLLVRSPPLRFLAARMAPQLGLLARSLERGVAAGPLALQLQPGVAELLIER